MKKGRPAWLRAVLTAALVAFCSACGGGRSGPGPADAPKSALPLIPVGLIHTAALPGPLIDGKDAVESSGATTDGAALVLHADGGGLSYAMWAIDPGSLSLSAVQARLTTYENAKVWLGMADYSKGSWQLSGPYLSGAPAHVCAKGGFASPSGAAYFIAVAVGGKVRIDQLAVGLFVDFPAASSNLMWSQARMAALATASGTEYKEMISEVRSAAEYYRGWTVPSDGEWWGPHQNGVMALAVAWRLSGDPACKTKLLDYLRCVSKFSDLRGGREGAEDLDLGVCLTNISVSYSWVRDSLEPETRGKLDALVLREAQHADELFQSRRTRYYWNHAHYIATGLYAAGCLLDSYSPDAAKWRAEAAAFYDEMEALQDQRTDAGYPEGCAYASAVYYLAAQYRELRRSFTGAAPERGWWAKVPQYFACTLRPDLCETIRLADDDGKYIYPPDGVLRYAAACSQSTLAQRLARELHAKAGNQKDSFPLFVWQAALFTDPDVAAAQTLGPESAELGDLGLAVSRSSWAADASLLAVRSGLPGGSVYNAYLAAHPEDGNGGLGHLQCDLNSLSWWSDGTSLLADYGFENVKLTDQHNTVTVSGYGQCGESGAWWGWGWNWKPWGYGGDITKAGSNGADIYQAEMRCDDAYVPNAKLNKFRRRVLWLRPNLLLVQDRVGLSAPGDIEVNWQTELGAWSVTGSAAVAGGRLHSRVLGRQPDHWNKSSLGIDGSTTGWRLQPVYVNTSGQEDLAQVFWDSAAAGGWLLQEAGQNALTFSDGSRQAILRLEGEQIVLRGYRALDLPWTTI